MEVIDNRQEYVVGFCHDDETVVMVRKNRPEWQAGYLNGVGGHIEQGETPLQAMIREFEEETSVGLNKWNNFLTMRFSNATIYFFESYYPEAIEHVRTTTDEEIVKMKIVDVETCETIDNIRWILPLAVQSDKYHSIVVDSKELA